MDRVTSSSSPVHEPAHNHADALFECITEGRASGKRHKYNKFGPMGPYMRAARWIPAGINPFIDPRGMLYDGMQAEFSRNGAEATLAADESIPQRTLRLRNIDAFEKFKGLLPDFTMTINEFEDHPTLMEEFVDIIAENARSARSEDVYKIRTRGIRHILGTDFETSSFNPPLDPFGDKIHRGWNHPQTARALCPLHSLDNFDRDPEAFMDSVKNGQMKIKSGEFPTFLYPSGTTFDSDHRDRGLLRSETLVRTFRLLFTGASSAATGVSPKGVKKCKAAIHGMREPTPETIAYAAVLSRFSLSSVESWSNTDGAFQLDRFWRYIVQLFDPERGMHQGWIRDTMEWWRAQTPGLNALPSVNDLDYSSGDDEDNDFVMLRRQITNGHVDNDNHSEASNIRPGVTQPITTWNDNSSRTPSGPRRSADIDIYGANTQNGNDRFTPVHARSARAIQNTHRTPSPGTRRPSGIQLAEPPRQVVSPRVETYRSPRNVQATPRGSPGPWTQTPLITQHQAQASMIAEVQRSSHAQRRLHRSQSSQFVSPGNRGLPGSQNAIAFIIDSARSPSQSSLHHRSQTLQFTQSYGQGPRDPHHALATGAGIVDARHTSATMQDLASPSSGARPPLQPTQHSAVNNSSQTLQSTQSYGQGPHDPHRVPATGAGIVDAQHASATIQDLATPSPGARPPLQPTQHSTVDNSDQTLQSTQSYGQGPRDPHHVPAAGAGIVDARHTSATMQDLATPSPGARPPLQPTQRAHSQAVSNPDARVVPVNRKRARAQITQEQDGESDGETEIENSPSPAPPLTPSPPFRRARKAKAANKAQVPSTRKVTGRKRK